MGKQFDVDSRGYVNVYTDGSCLDSGTSGARAGIGVWFGENSRFNVSAPVDGPADNNVAEIQAVTKAAQVVYGVGMKKLHVYTDSENVIKCYKEGIPMWNKNGWKNDVGDPVVHKADLQEMESALKLLTVEFTLVPAHTGNYGNKMADQLARQGAEKCKRN